MDEMKIETGYGTWYVRVATDSDLKNRVWFRMATGGMTISAYIKSEDAVAMAGRLLAAAGHDDPVDIPVGEATISDWATLEAAQ